MSKEKYIVKKTSIIDICNTIRHKLGTKDKIQFNDIPSKIREITGGEGEHIPGFKGNMIEVLKGDTYEHRYYNAYFFWSGEWGEGKSYETTSTSVEHRDTETGRLIYTEIEWIMSRQKTKSININIDRGWCSFEGMIYNYYSKPSGYIKEEILYNSPVPAGTFIGSDGGILVYTEGSSAAKFVVKDGWICMYNYKIYYPGETVLSVNAGNTNVTLNFNCFYIGEDNVI